MIWVKWLVTPIYTKVQGRILHTNHLFKKRLGGLYAPIYRQADCGMSTTKPIQRFPDVLFAL